MRSRDVGVPVAAALLGLALFAGDSVWTAVAVLVAVGAWAAPALLGRVPLPGGGYAALGLLLALAVWAGVSIAWSVAPDRSWAEVDRTLVYAAFLGAGLLFAAARPGAGRLAVAVLAGTLGAAVVWALAGKAIPGLFEDGARAARLRDPVGYWNALALAADMLLVLALTAAAAARATVVRLAGTALAYGAVIAILLAASRAGVAAAVLGLALWLWLRRDRVEASLLALAAVVPGLLVAGWAFTRPALVEDGASRTDRVADGVWFGLLVLAGGALVALAARELARRPLTPGRRDRIARVLRGAVVAAAVLAALGAVAGAGRLADEFRGEEVGNDPSRIASLSSNNRAAWWREAGDIFEAKPLAGAGANTFEVARKRYRESASAVTQPHSVPLQFLAGTGLVGLALFLALVGVAGATAVGAVRRTEGGERDAAAALAVALALWLAHALVDYDWDFVEVTGPALFALGVLAAAARPARAGRFPLAAAGVAALTLAAAASAVTPWLADREVGEASARLDRRDFEGAEAAADRARSLDPLSLEPLFAQALVEEARGRDTAAHARYEEATRLQPENPETWLALGLYEFDRGDRCAAYFHLNEAYTLDPAGKQWTKDSELEQSRAWVNAGNCS